MRLPPSLIFMLPLAFVAVGTLPGCRSNVQALREAAAPPPTLTAMKTTGDGSDALPTSEALAGPPPATPPQALEAPLKELSPVSGVGLVVCEPVARNADAATGDFGAGCGRWLFFTVGGQPQLGRTPLWSEVERVQRELGKPNLRLALPDAVKMNGILGATHVAVGTITGSAAHCTLSYRLWAVPHGKALGAPLVVSGTESQVLDRLPNLARQMAQRLGVTAPHIPGSVGARSGDLILAGQVPWGPTESPSAAQTASLRALAAHWPLAALLALDVGLRGDPQLPALAHALLTEAPDNPFGYSQLGYVQASSLRPFHVALAARLRQSPNNYLLAHACVWWGRASGDRRGEYLAAVQTARDAPGNPDAWLALGFTLADQAERLRRSRTADALSAPEWQSLNTVYPRWLAAVSRAARLDPRYGHAWSRVAQAATFAGQSAVADRAFWNALRLDPDHADVFDWGLQMYQQKWGGDPVTLGKVATLAAADHYPTVGEAITVANDLEEAGFPDQAKSLLDGVIADARTAAQRAPNDADAHWTLAAALKQRHRPAEAIPEYQAAVLLKPKDAALHHEYAEALHDQSRSAEAIAEYQTALRLTPQNSEWHYDLGWELKHAGQMAPAEQEMRLAVQTDPANPDAHFGLGEVLSMTHRELPAIAEYQKTADTAPYPFDALRRLAYLQDNNGRYDAAIAAGLKVIAAFPDDSATMDNIADCYLHKKQWASSLVWSGRAVQINPNDAVAHENLGEAYLGEGDRAKARGEWQQVVLMDRGRMSQVARDYLAKYP